MPPHGQSKVSDACMLRSDACVMELWELPWKATDLDSEWRRRFARECARVLAVPTDLRCMSTQYLDTVDREKERRSMK